ncbi:transcriptional activator NhaR [Alteromonas oceanisediminis]|uniref:transcriptional activator NhaR n=1 Tax=Alteromonas oceanisediminis TaxID=2836180 RepID=UPI001BDB6177|nr:transcriptional activator NhaR [Alteromonas oceanisediminis]MBT0586513.1 transcriptional activator NhaR [Alteromonas oceanisediminis]
MAENMNYKHLHYFWVVAKEGSIAKAAAKLHITPQTISGQLSMLEDRLNQPLFDRVGRGLQLTETGRLVLRYADEIFELGRELSDVLRGAPQFGASEFIVSAASAIPKTIVYKIVEPALNLSEDINLVSKEGPIDAIVADLAVHDVDMVLTDTPLSAAFSIKAYNHFLGESGLSFFAAPKLAEQLSGQFPDNLNHKPMLLPTKQYAIRQLFDRWTSDIDLFPVIKGQFDDSALMKSFGQAGLGVFFMPTVIEQEVCDQFKVEVVGRTEDIKQRFYAISSERKVTHPAVAAICDKARDIIFK